MNSGLSRRPWASRRCVRGTGALLMLLAWPWQDGHSQVPTGTGQSVLAGSRVFGAKGCADCHAIGGLGGTVGPDLGRTQQSNSFFDFGAAMWNHLPRMATQMRGLGIEEPHVSPWEVGDLIAFLYWADYFDAPGDVARGQRLFATKQCVACHQVGGAGGIAGPALDFLGDYGAPIQLAASMWNHSPQMNEAIRNMGLTRPTLSGAELTDLLAYLKTAAEGVPEHSLYVLPGHADLGRQVFAAKGCLQCHSVGGAGGGVGPNLAQRARHTSLTSFAAAMWNKAPAMLAAIQRRGIQVPQLHAEEMADVVAYLYSVRYFGDAGDARRGRSHLRTKGCLACHALDGAAGGTASDLGAARRVGSPAAVIAALWNHLALHPDSLDRSDQWPQLQPGDLADLTAFFQELSLP